MPDRYGHPDFTDGQQIAALRDELKRDGFEGDIALRAEAWWFSDGPPGDVPSEEAAQEWKARRRLEAPEDDARVEREIIVHDTAVAQLSAACRARVATLEGTPR